MDCDFSSVTSPFFTQKNFRNQECDQNSMNKLVTRITNLPGRKSEKKYKNDQPG